MSVPLLLYLIAGILALVTLFQSEGRSLIGWAVLFVCAGLLYGQLPL